MSSPLAVYAEMLAHPQERSVARLADGSELATPVHRWTAAVDAVDERALHGVRGPVLDVGCGPGRHLAALARRGVDALGVDISPVAVDLARRTGARAVVASIFDELPEHGRWGDALLLDGNIGIGGRPARLLSRMRELLAPGGRLVVELAPPWHATRRTRLRLETARASSDWFDWAVVSAGDADELLASAEYTVTARWHEHGRWFLVAVAGAIARSGPGSG